MPWLWMDPGSSKPSQKLRRAAPVQSCMLGTVFTSEFLEGQDVLAVGGQLEGRVARPVGQVRVGAEHDLLAGLHHEARGQGVHEGLVGIVRD